MSADVGTRPAVDLRVESVTMRFGGVTAVDDVTIRHDSGGVLGLIGPNGAGKTTLFNILSGVIVPTAGTVVLDDRELTRLRPDRVARLGVARTFQNLQLFGSLTVLENVLVAAGAQDAGGLTRALVPTPASRTMKRRRRREALELLDRVGIGHLAETVAATLPYGLQRRVEVARALAIRPRLLLLDEPLAGLSRAESTDLAELMRDLAGTGLTVVLVEHDVATVMQVSDRVVVLDHGTLLADGTAHEVQGDPRVRAAYLGEEAAS